MPAPVPLYATGTFPSAKSLVLALYSCDGSGDHPNGIAFHSQRPILFDAYNITATLTTNTTGKQTALSTSGSTTSAWPIYDTAGYFGMSQDEPGLGYYQFTAAVKGSSGDGQTPGGWTILTHMVPVIAGSTQTSVSADMTATSGSPVSGTRQAPTSSLDSCPFFCDLVSTPGGVNGTTFSPAVTIADSASASAHNAVSATDSSGETPRFTAIWAAVSAAAAGQAVFAPGGTYPFTTPDGVTELTVAATAAGGGGGAGNTSPGGIEFGGGGAGGGEFAGQNFIGVTPLNNYTVVVGTGGLGGTTGPSTAGAAGGDSTFAGDATSVTANGGSGGAAATTTADGAGASGGSGSGATTEFHGGAGANGVTAQYGGGGGSSAGTGHAGATATGPQGAPAPVGGGPGGAGGFAPILVVQHTEDSITNTNFLTVTFAAPVQAGNTVIAMVYYQGAAPTQDPVVTLSDGSGLGSVVTADLSDTTSLQVGLFSISGVAGGETGIAVQAFGTNNSVKILASEIYEVSGLGPSPSVDASSSHTQGPSSPDSFYQSTATGSPVVTTGAPDLWVGFVGAKHNNPFSIFDPASSQGWNGQSPVYRNHGGIYAGIKSAYQTVTTAGPLLFSGRFSGVTTKGTLAAAFTATPPTAGASPNVGPGGGGGGGLGSANGGGPGADGQVILTWTGISGSGYGTPPTPAPYTGWTAQSTIGTTSVPDVNLNSSAGIAGVLNFLSNPPVMRVGATIAQSITSSTLTNIAFSATQATVDSYAGWNPSTGTYTIQRPGLYLFHGLVAFSNAFTSGTRRAGVTINGTTYWGPPSVACTSTTTNVAKTQIFSLQAGDTVKLACRQSSGNALGLSSTDQTRFFLVWLGLEGVPASVWTPPDISYRWATGTDGSVLPGDFQQHLANDLGFLVSRPYLLAYQTVAQTGLPTGGFQTPILDTTTGLVHNTDAGDNYAGWTSGSGNNYTAPASGWYLACGEFFSTAASSLPAVVTAGVLPSTSGGRLGLHGADYHQALQATTVAGTGGGAALFGIYYALQGELITPQMMCSTTGFGSTFSTLTGSQAGGFFYPHFELCFLSE